MYISQFASKFPSQQHPLHFEMFARVPKARLSAKPAGRISSFNDGTRSLIPHNNYNLHFAKRSFTSSLPLRSAQVLKHIEETKKSYIYPEPEADEVYVPQQRLGVNFQHNWSLSPLQIHPAGDSYGNLDVANLISRSFGKQEKNKALVVDANEANTPEQLVTPDPREHDLWPEHVEDLDPKFARRIWKEVGYYLSHIPHSFVRDSVTSSSVSGEVSARIISDNAVSDLFLSNMMLRKSQKSLTNRAQLVAEAALERGDEEEIQRLMDESIVQARRDIAQFKHDWNITLLNAPGYRFELERIVEEFGGPRPSDLGLRKPHFVFSDPVKRMAIIGGIYDNVASMDTLAYLTARHTFQEHRNLVLPADVVFTDGNVTMVIGNDMNDVLGLRNEGSLSKLYSAHHSVWAKDGLSKVWGGVALETSEPAETLSLKEGVLVEELGKGKRRVARQLEGMRPNAIKSPTAIILAVGDSSGKHVPEVSLLDLDMAVKTIVTGLKQVENGQPEFSLGYTHENFNTVALPRDLEATVRDLLSDSDAKVFIINKNSSNAKRLVSDITSGKVPPLKSVSGVRGWSASSNADRKDISSLASAITTNFAEAQKLE